MEKLMLNVLNLPSFKALKIAQHARSLLDTSITKTKIYRSAVWKHPGRYKWCHFYGDQRMFAALTIQIPETSEYENSKRGKR